MRAWSSYAAVGLVLTLAAALVAGAMVSADERTAVWFAAGLSYLLQLAAFAALVGLREHAQLFLIGWAAGIVLRFGALAAVAFWLSLRPWLPLDVTLISMASFVVLLLFLEPVFLRRGHTRR